MNKVPKLVESWEDGNTLVEIYEEFGALPHNSDHDTVFYSLRIISKDSRKFPVVTGAINEAKAILRRKNHRKLHKIRTDFDESGKEE